MDKKLKLCECGCRCRQLVNLGKRFLRRHNHRGIPKSEKHKKKIAESNRKVIHSKLWCKRISESNKGRKHSEETKRKMSKAHKGIPKSEEHRRNMSKAKKGHGFTKETLRKIREGNKGKKRSEKTRKRMSRGQQKYWSDPENRRKCSGENSPCWKGGISFEPYSIEFTNELRRNIRERDNYICQLCNEKQNGRKFDVHHIDYDKDNSHPKNLITLCRSCNVIVNSDRKVWMRIFQNRMIKGYV